MKLASKLKMAVALGLLLSVPVVKQIDSRVSAHEGENHVTQAQAQTPTATVPQTPVRYQYKAQTGDSYSVVARKAIQTYGKKFNSKLSAAKIIFAETHLTQEAGSPLLDINQAVTIDEAKVKAWVDQAAKLTPQQEAAWAAYVPGVNFNTDTVGQAR